MQQSHDTVRAARIPIPHPSARAKPTIVAKDSMTSPIQSSTDPVRVIVQDSFVITKTETLVAKQFAPSVEKSMPSMSDIFVIVLLLFILVERFFLNRLSIASKKDISDIRKEISQMKSEFAKLSTVLGAFIMNVNFKREGDKLMAESKLKESDTQIMVSAKEMRRLREIEKESQQEYLDKLLKQRNEDRETTENR